MWLENFKKFDWKISLYFTCSKLTIWIMIQVKVKLICDSCFHASKFWYSWSFWLILWARSIEWNLFIAFCLSIVDESVDIFDKKIFKEFLACYHNQFQMFNANLKDFNLINIFLEKSYWIEVKINGFCLMISEWIIVNVNEIWYFNQGIDFI
jgi:hypothetical protein